MHFSPYYYETFAIPENLPPQQPPTPPLNLLVQQLKNMKQTIVTCVGFCVCIFNEIFKKIQKNIHYLIWYDMLWSWKKKTDKILNLEVTFVNIFSLHKMPPIK